MKPAADQNHLKSTGHPHATSLIGAAFLRHGLAAFLYRLPTILTDKGVAFDDHALTKYDWTVRSFNRACLGHGSKHKLTRPYHPWSNGQAECMNRTLKEGTVKCPSTTRRRLPRQSSNLHRSVQLRQAPQDAAPENTLPDYLGGVDKRLVSFYDHPAPTHPGIVHLAQQ